MFMQMIKFNSIRWITVYSMIALFVVVVAFFFIRKMQSIWSALSSLQTKQLIFQQWFWMELQIVFDTENYTKITNPNSNNNYYFSHFCVCVYRMFCDNSTKRKMIKNCRAKEKTKKNKNRNWIVQGKYVMEKKR